jgi:Ca2+-binding RTX toxin-like protein
VLSGDGGNDVIYGGVGEDLIDGGTGNDNLFGGDDDDFLDGNSGADYLFGGDQRDTLIGNTGSDTLEGGNGNDEFIITDNDTTMVSEDDVIVDFDTFIGSSGDIDKLTFVGFGPEMDSFIDILANSEVGDADNDGAFDDTVVELSAGQTLTFLDNAFIETIRFQVEFV